MAGSSAKATPLSVSWLVLSHNFLSASNLSKGPACKDADAVPDPQTFKLGRPSSAYMHFGHGVHECLGREIALTYSVALLKIVASLKNLRPAPGEMGTLKAVTIGTERCYLDDTWSNLTFDPTSETYSFHV